MADAFFVARPDGGLSERALDPVEEFHPDLPADLRGRAGLVPDRILDRFAGREFRRTCWSILIPLVLIFGVSLFYVLLNQMKLRRENICASGSSAPLAP